MPRVCPQCQTPQPWVMWRLCGCGHNFGLAHSEPPPLPESFFHPPSSATPIKLKAKARWRLILKVTAALIGVCWGIHATSDFLFSVGWEHYRRGGGVFVDAPIVPAEMAEALANFEWAGRINPLSAEAFNYQGIACLYLNRAQDSLHRFDSTLRFHPGNFTAHYGKACAYLKLRDYQPMVAELQKCIEIEPDPDREVRFSEDFASVKDEPFMAPFRSRLK